MSVRISLRHGDSNEILETLEENSIDCVVTDPPYGISFMQSRWDYELPSIELWKKILKVLKPGGYMLAFGGSRTYHRLTCSIEDAGFRIKDCIIFLYGTGFPKNKSALKPAYEPIILCQKQISEKNIAENISKYGTGTLNIDGCRIPTEDTNVGWNGLTSDRSDSAWDNSGYKGTDETRKLRQKIEKSPKTKDIYGNFADKTGEVSWTENVKGRWPANTIHDGSEEVMSEFDKYGVKTSGSMSGTYKNTMMKNDPGNRDGKEVYLEQKSSSGSVARFFYCAKVSGFERALGLEGTSLKNHHPCLKSVELLRYLVRLICPENGIVLDPFAGSGSTGLACIFENKGFFGIEREKEYVEIAKARLTYFHKNKAELLKKFSKMVDKILPKENQLF